MSHDLTDGQESEDALKVALDFAESIIATLREPFVVLNRDLRVKMANRAFFESFHVSKERKTENRLVYELGDGQWDIPLLRTLLSEVLFEGLGNPVSAAVRVSQGRHSHPRRPHFENHRLQPLHDTPIGLRAR